MRLTSANIAEYLAEKKLCEESEKDKLEIQPIVAKNFNFLVTFPNCRQLLVKQERQNKEGNTANEFQKEQQIKDLFAQFTELAHLSSSLSTIIEFDRERSIIIFEYLSNYRDLSEFYNREHDFDPQIATSLGKAIAEIHRATFQQPKYREFLQPDRSQITTNQVAKVESKLARISPEIFSLIPTDCLKFFSLYQRYDSLGKAISELGDSFVPSCLTHNDLKLNNILIHNDWEDSSESTIRLIDWERSGWGDPAFDLGTLIGSYVQMWLSSLVISSSLRIEESLQLAIIPLEALQPAIANLTISYLENFPEIMQQRPDFLRRAIQNAGFLLIVSIQAMIQYQKSFGNVGIGMLQGAKSLLCRPESAMNTLFGSNAAKIAQFQNYAT